MIRWQDLDPARVERAVKLLIRGLYPNAQAIDGSGGDDGRDIRWDASEGLVIFEVKSYAVRLTSKQKSDIRASLTKAARHVPVRWALILPLDPSPAEEQWFDRLRNEFADIRLQWYGRDWLDYQFAHDEALRRYVEGTDYALLQRAAELGQEQAALGRGVNDLVARLCALHARAQELSPNWGVDFTAAAGFTILRISARGSRGQRSYPIIWSTIFDLRNSAQSDMEAYYQLIQDLNIAADGATVEKYLEPLKLPNGKSADAGLPSEAVFDVAANLYYQGTTNSESELVQFSSNDSEYLYDMALERMVVIYRLPHGLPSKDGADNISPKFGALLCGIEEYLTENPGALLSVRFIYAPGEPTHMPSRMECIYLTDDQLRVTVYPYSWLTIARGRLQARHPQLTFAGCAHLTADRSNIASLSGPWQRGTTRAADTGSSARR